MYLRSDRFRPNFLPGLYFYKFLYVWLDLVHPDGQRSKNLGWLYWLPNPLSPFIWYRVAVPGSHPELAIEELPAGGGTRERGRARSSEVIERLT